MTLPTLIILINYARLPTMPGCKNPTPTDEAAAHCTKLAELEQACEQLLEEEREAVVAAEACEREVAVTQHGWSAILCWFFGWIMLDS